MFLQIGSSRVFVKKYTSRTWGGKASILFITEGGEEVLGFDSPAARDTALAMLDNIARSVDIEDLLRRET